MHVKHRLIDNTLFARIFAICMDPAAGSVRASHSLISANVPKNPGVTTRPREHNHFFDRIIAGLHTGFPDANTGQGRDSNIDCNRPWPCP